VENGIIEQKETKKTKVGSETSFASLSSVISSEPGARSDELIEDRRWEIGVRSEPSNSGYRIAEAGKILV
jgi:hypothetical protein